MASDKGDEYRVGHGKPPIEYQFRKGESGNPSGRPRRPKGDKSIAQKAQEILNEKVTVSINGKRKRISLEEFALRKYIHAEAASGSFYNLEGLKQHLRLKD